MNWDEAINTISPHVVKIATPTGYGTGFLAFYNLAGDWCGFATAAHVVSHADESQQPIRIKNEVSSAPRFLRADERVIFLDHATDSAVVLFLKGSSTPREPYSTPANGRALRDWSGHWLAWISHHRARLSVFFRGVLGRLLERPISLMALLLTALAGVLSSIVSLPTMLPFPTVFKLSVA
jgi:hypothetical protein